MDWILFAEQSLNGLQFGLMLFLLAAGLTLEGVKELEPCLDMHDLDACDDPAFALETYRARLAVVEQRMAALRHHRDELARRVDELAGH